MRRLACLFLLTAGLFGSTALVDARVASAHPLGNFTVNRYSALVLTPRRIEVRYVLDMAEIPTFQEEPNIDADGDGIDTPAERRAWADRTTADLLSNLVLSVNGGRATLGVEGDSMRFLPGQAGLPTLRLEATFGAPLAESGTVEYRDANYAGRIGWKEVTARSPSGLLIEGSTVPSVSVSRELSAYPVDLLASPLDVTRARFSFRPGDGPGQAAAPRGGATVSGAPVADGGSFAGLVSRPLTPLVLVLSLLLAFGFGAVHALGPGHGKTITAAYLVGREARIGQAAAVGLAVAIMHTASVLALGLLLFVLARSFPTDRVYPWLTLATGAAALGLGAGLFLVRLGARRRARDRWHGHDHPHPAGRPLSGRGLLALAVAGGILPSPTAFVVLTGSVSAHRVGYGLGLIMAFSLGLAAALVAVGILALRVRGAMGRRVRSGWLGIVPLLSAGLIMGIGLFFAVRGIAQIA